MHKSIITFTSALTLAALATSPAMAAEPVKAPTSVDSCMLLLVMSGNKIEAAKLKGEALAAVKKNGQAMAMQCQTKKFVEAFTTYQAMTKLLAAK